MRRNAYGSASCLADEIAAVFAGIAEPCTMQRFFEEILTPAEREDLALRWRLMKMLHNGIAQREIASTLGVSLCKITRGAKVLKLKKSISRSILNSHRHRN